MRVGGAVAAAAAAMLYGSAYVATGIALRSFGPTGVAVWAAVLALVLLGQGLTPLQLLGGACVLAAIAVASGAFGMPGRASGGGITLRS